MEFIALLIALAASAAGGICGIGGGVIIKPLFDLIGFAGATEVSFLSSCTVLSMSLYNFAKSRFEHSHALDASTGVPLAAGAAAGGVAGNLVFKVIKRLAGNESAVGATQAAVLLVLVIGTFLYTLYKKKIKPLAVTSPWLCVLIGVGLGTASSFLGIGGGPFNLVVLHYFLGQDTKKAVENSLFIILLSQAANLCVTLVTSSVPDFEWLSLVLMIAGGIGGGIIGKAAGKRISADRTDKLFLGLLCVIALICGYNIVKNL